MCQREIGNQHDLLAVAMLKQIDGHNTRLSFAVVVLFSVIVADNVAQIEVSVFLQNSWDKLITNRNLQGSSSPP